MGSGNKFKFSNVLPNVFNKIKGVGPRKITGRAKGSDSSSIALTGACDHHLDQKVYRFGNRKNADRDRSISPSGHMFSHTNRNKDARHSLSPVVVGGGGLQRSYDIRFPAESPIRSTKDSKSRSHSPPPQYLVRAIQNSAAGQSDPGCCSFDSSTLALVPHVDGRQRKEFSPVFGRCSIMAKCNSFRGSTHSDSEISETETTSSKALSRRRLHQSRNRSAHLGSSRRSTCCELEGCCYDAVMPSAEGKVQKLQDGGASSLRRGSNFQQQLRKDQSPRIVNHEQLYGGSSPIHPAAPVAEARLIYNSSNSPAGTPAATARYYGTSAAQEKDGARECRDSAGAGGAGGVTPRSRSRERSRQRQRHAQTPPDGLQFKDRGSSRKLSFAGATTYTGAEPGARKHYGDVDTSFSSEDEGGAYSVVRGGSKDCSSNAKVSLNSSRSRTRSSSAPKGSIHSDVVKPQQRIAYSRVDDANRAEYMAREMLLELEAGDDLKDSSKIRYQVRDPDEAALQRERILAKTVLEASDGWARRQLSKFSQNEKSGRTTVDYGDLHLLGGGSDDSEVNARSFSAAAARVHGGGKDLDATTGSWDKENVLAIVRLDDSKLVPVGSRLVSLSKLRDGHGDQPRFVLKRADEDFDGDYNEDEKSVGHRPIRTLRSPPHSSRDFSSLKSPKTPSPMGEVEKRTEGRIAYKSSSSPAAKADHGRNAAYSKPKLLSRMFADEELSSRSASSGDGKCSSGPGDDVKKFASARMETDVKEIGIPWDADYPSFRSDSMLFGAVGGTGAKMGSSGRVMPEERVSAATQVDFFDMQDSKVPTPRTPRNVERQRQSKIGAGYQEQETPTRSSSGKNSVRSRSPASRESAIKAAGLKSFGTATAQSKSPSRRPMPELSSSSSSTRQGRTPSTGSPCSIQEFPSAVKKLPNRSPSPVKDANSTSKRFTNRSPLRTNGHGSWQNNSNNSNSGSNQPASTPPPQGSTNSRAIVNKPGRRSQSPARDQSPTAPARPKRLLSAKAEAGMQRLDSVAVVKASYDPYHDFRESMVEMILENDIRTAGDLEHLLQCYLSLNLADYHKVIVQVFTDIWGDIFDP